MTLQQIEQELREALPNLYNPDAQPTPLLSDLFRLHNPQGDLDLQSWITQQIKSVKPAEEVPTGSRLVRFYEVLNNRFVLRLTLEETALRMHLSLSSTWREQRAAIHQLANELWRHRQTPTGSLAPQSGAENLEPDSRSQDDQSPDWLGQSRRELASIQTYSPDPVSDVSQVIEGVLEIERPLALKRGVALEVGSLKRDLVAGVHPSVLRQLLIITIGNFLRRMSGGRLSLFARLEDGNVKITIAGNIDADNEFSEEDFSSDLPLPEESAVEIYREGRQVFLWLRLPYVNRVNVLVIDDNQDLVRFYQRATEGTSYRIIPSEGTGALFDTILKARPVIIVLDVMLPEVDGWEVLMQIRANPVTRTIPVIICSIVKEEELALSLGASRFISKPVQAEDFVRALDQVLVQVP